MLLLWRWWCGVEMWCGGGRCGCEGVVVSVVWWWWCGVVVVGVVVKVWSVWLVWWWSVWCGGDRCGVVVEVWW